MDAKNLNELNQRRRANGEFGNKYHAEAEGELGNQSETAESLGAAHLDNDPLTEDLMWDILDEYKIASDAGPMDSNYVYVGNPETGHDQLVKPKGEPRTVGEFREALAEALEEFNVDDAFDAEAAESRQWPASDQIETLQANKEYFAKVAAKIRADSAIEASSYDLPEFDASDGYGRRDYSGLKVSGTVSMTKFKNALKKARPDLEVDLRNIRINGSLRGCSGFITDPRTGRTVYVDTEPSGYRNTVYFRGATDTKDYHGGRNNMTMSEHIVSESLRFLETSKYQRFYEGIRGDRPEPSDKTRQHELFLEDHGIHYQMGNDARNRW